VWTLLGSALKLSLRELQIVQGVFQDLTSESIAHELGISHHTVNTYFQRLYTKLQVSSRPQLIVLVVAEYLRLTSNGQMSAVSRAHATDGELT
jgi:DNA-binding CsgD family transcriptional regulator